MFQHRLIKNLIIPIISGLLIASALFAANRVYYDLDNTRVVTDEAAIFNYTITLPNSNVLTGTSNYVQFSAGISVGGATTYYINSSGSGNLNTLNLSGNLLTSASALTIRTSATEGADDIIFQPAGTEKFRILENGDLFFERGAYDLTLSPAAPSGSSRTLTIPALGSDANLSTYSGTMAAGDLFYGATTNVAQRLTIGSSGTILSSSGSAPQWSTLSSLNIPTGTGAENRVTFWTGANSISYDDAFVWDNTNKRLGLSATSPSTRLDVSGLTINTDADGTVMAARFTGSITKNDSNTRTFLGLSITPTLNTGSSNANTTFNVLNIDTTNTAITGLTTNLIKASYGGSQKFLVDSSGNLTISGTTTFNGQTYAWPGAHVTNGYLKNDGSGNLTWATLEGALQKSGSPQANYVAYWSGTDSVTGVSDFYWDPTNKRLGIGTTGPSASLHVLGTTEQLRLGYDASNAVKFTVGSANALTITPLVNSTTAFNFTNAAGTSVLNVDATNQRVGIGTTGPTKSLDVFHTSSDQLALSQASGVNTLFRVDSSGDLTITPSGDEIFIPDDNLRICAGGSCPAADYSGTGNLQVEGRVQINQATGSSPLIVNSTTVVTNLNADMVDGYHATSLQWPADIVCGTGFTNVGTYCIQTNENSAATWWNAAVSCRSNYNGARLCSTSEWYAACQAGLLTNGTNNYEWVDDWYSRQLLRFGDWEWLLRYGLRLLSQQLLRFPLLQINF